MIRISREQAASVRAILEQECGLTTDSQGRDGFIMTISDPVMECQEYRFQGALGFGGKFRNNGNFDNTPYVDCYPEDRTPERMAMIERANTRLARLFGTDHRNRT